MKQEEKKERMINYSIMFPPSLWAELKDEARKRRWSVSCLVRDIIEQWQAHKDRRSKNV